MGLGGALHYKCTVEHVHGGVANRLPLGNGFEGFFYAKQPNKDGDLVTMRVSAGTAPSLPKAWRLLQAACQLRDMSPAEARHVNVLGKNLLSTHFCVEVVSSLFVDLSHMERLDMVLNALHGFEKKVNEQNGEFPSQLAMKVTAPVQHTPQITPHGGLSGNGPPGSVSKVSMHVKKAQSPGFLRGMLDCGLKLKTREPDYPGSLIENKAHVLGHFFHSLPQKHQKFVITKQRRADNMLKRAHHSTLTPVSGHLEKKRKSVTLPCSMQNLTKRRDEENAQIVAAFTMGHMLEAQLAKRIQRIFRNSLFVRAFWEHNRRWFSIIRIQRYIRGCYGRFFAKLFAKIAPSSATRIATQCRIRIAVRKTTQLCAQQNGSAKQIQKLLRRHQALLYVAWIQQHWKYATRFEHVIRQQVAAWRHTALLFGFMPSQGLHPSRSSIISGPSKLVRTNCAATWIVSAIRGALCRSHYQGKLSRHIYQQITWRAQYLLQRTLRGYIGRQSARYAKMKQRSAVAIQRVLRGRTKFVWRSHIRLLEQKANSAVLLQGVARGYLGRVYAQLKRNEAFRFRLSSIVVPRFQAYARQKSAVQIAAERRAKFQNSIKVQRAWRQLEKSWRARDEYHQKLLRMQECAMTRITSLFRGFLARNLCLAKRHAATGHRIKSARTILRAWLRYQSAQQFSVLKNTWDIDRSARKLMIWHTLQNDIHFDMEDVRADIGDIRASRRWARKRIRSLREFISESQLRLPKVETQIGSVDASDIEQGWREALENEWERLTSQLTLAMEEKRLMKIHMGRCEAQLLELQLEYEEIETNIDEISVREQEEFELLRQLEIRRADVCSSAGWQKRVRRERTHWRVRDVRARLLRRERETKLIFLKRALIRREIAMSSTLSVHKRAQYLNAARHEAVRQDNIMRSRMLDLTGADKEGSMSKLKEAFDNALSGCAALLQNASLNARSKV